MEWNVYYHDINSGEIKPWNIFKHCRFKKDVDDMTSQKSLSIDEFEKQLKSSRERIIRMAFIKALVTNFAITAVWYWYEYKQFGELQWNRKCDNVVWCLYLIVLWYAFKK